MKTVVKGSWKWMVATGVLFLGLPSCGDAEVELAPDQEELVKERLRGLGYMA